MTSDIIVTKIGITRRGELHFFQVNIPRDVEAITGIQTGILGMRLPAGVKPAGKNHIGTIRLQADTPANMCYCTEVYTGTGDLENMLTGFGGAGGDMIGMFTFPFASGSSSGAERTMICEAYTLYGCYEDIIGKQLNADISYTIGLYLWTENATDTQR